MQEHSRVTPPGQQERLPRLALLHSNSAIGDVGTAMEANGQTQRVPAARVLSLLLLWLPVSAAVHAVGPSLVDPASQAACYTNETACESAAANVGLCGSGQSSQCVARSRTRAQRLSAFAGRA